MSGRGRPLVAWVASLGGALALVAAMVSLARPASPATPARRPDAEAEGDAPTSLVSELVTYGVGYGLALALTLAAFAVVGRHLVAPATALWIVLALGLAQIVTHFRCFLHISLRRPARDDLLMILFSSLIIALMVGGTLVVLFNLRTRMM